jgi:NitT/TauT family transport system substrate-binding protein
MQTRRYMSFSLLVIPLLLISMLFAACGGSSTPNTTSGNSSNGPLINVSIGLGYIPDVQFAPFYVAVNKGYYKAAGLNVTLNHGIVPDIMQEMMAARDTFVFAGGDDTLVARDKGLPVVDVSTLYQNYPVCIIVPANSSIKTLADLKGHTIGLPGLYGSTYVGMLALLNSVHLTSNDVKLQTIGFTQVNALKSGSVDAVVGYTSNEPLQLERLGMPVRTFNVSDYQPMVSNGIITTESTLRDQGKNVVQPFVKATIQGMNYVIAHPAEAVQISRNFVPAMDVSKATAELQATIRDWKGSGDHPIGYNDLTTWQTMEQFMVSEKLIQKSLDVSKAFVNE